jgi:hypothetical protein
LPTELRVTLGYGAFHLNNAAYDALGRPDAVELMFDPPTAVIGMRAVDPARRNAFPVKPHTSGRYKRVSAGPFCAQFRIKVKGTVLFDRAEIGPGGILELPINSVVRVERGSR